MKPIRAKATAMVAVLVTSSGGSLSAQAVVSEPESASKHNGSPTSTSPEAMRTSIADAIQSAIGRQAGDPRFHPQADLNGDQIVNALDMAMFRLARRPESILTHASSDSPYSRNAKGSKAAVTGERIIIEEQTTIGLPGQTVSVRFLIRDNTTPLMGYTVEALAAPQSGAVGTVTANVALTDFFDPRNLIAAGGAVRDPFFSFIEDNGTGGVTVSTITDDGSTVVAVDGINDVLAQVFFDVPPDASGDFAVQLGSASALVDGNGAAVPFTFVAGTIRVLDPSEIPAVSDWGMVVLGLLIVTAGSVVLRTRPEVQA